MTEIKTIRNYLDKTLRIKKVFVFVGMAVFILGILMSNLVSGSMESQFSIVKVIIGFALGGWVLAAAGFIRIFALRCPACKTRLGRDLFMDTNSNWFGLGVPKNRNYCGFCGIAFDAPMP